MSDSEEHGVKLLAWHNDDAVAGIPIKKRRFLFLQSPSPPPSHMPSLPANHCDVPPNEPSFSEQESSVTDVCGQMPNSGPAVFRGFSGEYIEESLADRDVNTTLNYVSSPGNQELMFTLGTNATTDLSNGRKDNTSAFRPIVEKTEFQSAFREPELSLGEGSGGRKLVLSDKSAFNRVLGNNELPSASKISSVLSTGSQNLVESFVKQDKLDPCSLDLALAEGQYKHNDTESDFGSGNPCVNRSHWDLNTMMDTWEGSLSIATLNHGTGGDDSLDVRDIHRKKVETCPSQMIHQEPSGTHVMSGKCEVGDGDCHSNLSNAATYPGKPYGTDADLNLQLNTALGSLSHFNTSVSCASAVLSSHKKVSDLSLSVKPMSPTHGPKLAVAIAVKPEPIEDCSVKDIESVEVSNPELASHRIVKFEPCEGGLQEGHEAVCFNSVKVPSSCSIAIKSEPLAVPSQSGLRTVDGKLHCTEFHTHTLETPSSKLLQHTTGNVSGDLDLVPQALIADGNKIQHCTETFIVEDVPQVTSKSINTSNSDGAKLDFGKEMPINADRPKVTSQIIENFTYEVSESVVPDVNNSQNGQVMPIGADVPQDADQNVGKASEVVSESMTTMDDEFNSIKEASEVIGNASGPHLDAVFSNSKEQTVNDMPKICVQMFCSDDGVDDCRLDSYGNIEVVETDGKGKVGNSESCEHEFKSDGSRDAVGLTETVPKHHGDDNDFEDGEVRDLFLHGAIEGSREESIAKYVHAKEVADSVVPVDIPVTMPSHVDGNESKIQNPDESKDVHCTAESENPLCSVKNDAGLNTAADVKESSTIGMTAAGSGKKKLVKIVRKIPQDQLTKEKGLETKPLSNKTVSACCAAGIDDSQCCIGSQQIKARGNTMLPADHSALSRAEASVSCGATKCVRNKGDRSRIIHLNSSSNASSFGRTKSVHSRLFSSPIEKERLNDKSLRGETVHLRGNRDDSCFDGLHKSEKERSQDHQLRKFGSDLSSRIRGRVDRQLDTLRADWDPDHGYASDCFNSSTSFQLPIIKNASEADFAVGMYGSFGSAGRMVRKHVDDEQKNFCRLPSRRHSPGGRDGPVPVGIQMVHRTRRDISPGRCIEGLPELLILNHEEKLTRGLANEMVDPSPFERAHPKYEIAGNCLIRRERRSLSPFQRRGAPHLSHSCLTSSPRRRTRSPRLWSPSQRTSDGFDGRPELTRCRSPPVLRVERMTSPRQRACFPEEMMGRRRASPPYIPQLCDKTRDFGPLREHDLLRSGRHPQRNTRRFDVIDPRVNMEEEYFGHLHSGHLHSGQFHELEGEDECADERRNSDERCGLIHSSRQHYNVGNDETFHYFVEDVPRRPIRFCPELSEEFPDRGISRNDCIRNRLGNMHRRLRGMVEQEDNYRHDGGQGWHGDSFKDVRLKRRRF